MSKEISPARGQLWISSEAGHRGEGNRYAVVSDIRPNGQVLLVTWYDVLNGLADARPSSVRLAAFRPKKNGTWSFKTGWRPAKHMPKYGVPDGDWIHLIGPNGTKVRPL